MAKVQNFLSKECKNLESQSLRIFYVCKNFNGKYTSIMFKFFILERQI